MSKTINYPSQEWLDRWIDHYLDTHPDEKISDFKALQDKAENEWWLNEIEHDRPTPFDLTPEQKKAQKEVQKGMAKSDKPRKSTPRPRKPNENKRQIMGWIKTLFEGLALNRTIDSYAMTNEERTIEIFLNDKHYTLTLTEHRDKKE